MKRVFSCICVWLVDIQRVNLEMDMYAGNSNKKETYASPTSCINQIASLREKEGSINVAGAFDFIFVQCSNSDAD